MGGGGGGGALSPAAEAAVSAFSGSGVGGSGGGAGAAAGHSPLQPSSSSGSIRKRRNAWERLRSRWVRVAVCGWVVGEWVSEREKRECVKVRERVRD